jgi:large subunit ribosomal protein L16
MSTMPSKTKYRKCQKGNFKGLAKGATVISFGKYGMQVLERGWVTHRQIEACRVAINRKFARKGKVWIRIFPDKPVSKSLLKRVWERAKELRITGWLSFALGEFC